MINLRFPMTWLVPLVSAWLLSEGVAAAPDPLPLAVASSVGASGEVSEAQGRETRLAEPTLEGLPGPVVEIKAEPTAGRNRGPANLPRPSLETPAPRLGRRVLTRVAGQAGERVITSREVQINHAVESVLYPSSPRALGPTFTSLEAKGFGAEVNQVLLEWIVFLEAQSFSNTTVSKAELQKAQVTVTEALAKNAQWRALEVSSEELQDLLERKLTAKRFITFKTDSSLVPVTDAEALSYFQKNRLKFGNMPFSSFRENIKLFLVRQQVDRRLKDWFEVLQRKYHVRNMITGG